AAAAGTPLAERGALHAVAHERHLRVFAVARTAVADAAPEALAAIADAEPALGRHPTAPPQATVAAIELVEVFGGLLGPTAVAVLGPTQFDPTGASRRSGHLPIEAVAAQVHQ